MALFGPQWPLSQGEGDTFKVYTEPEDQIGFFLKNLLMTFKGENISDLDYGVGIRMYLFEQNLSQVRANLSSDISEQISTYLPYLTIDDISVSASALDVDNNSIYVKIVYTIPRNIIQAVFELQIDQDTTIGFY
jgi:phage baseplate assembly protein W|tara:strand:+ start:15086 stop:15487 length:402 start_codon:yes stop_codon:yes gene_type:complete